MNAYFQLRVVKESMHLLVLICPFGKFSILMVPMVWTSLGDFLNIETRCLLSGFDMSIETFDDVLLQQRSGSQANLALLS